MISITEYWTFKWFHPILGTTSLQRARLQHDGSRFSWLTLLLPPLPSDLQYSLSHPEANPQASSSISVFLLQHRHWSWHHLLLLPAPTRSSIISLLSHTPSRFLGSSDLYYPHPTENPIRFAVTKIEEFLDIHSTTRRRTRTVPNSLSAPIKENWEVRAN